MKKEKWEVFAKEYVVSLFPLFMLIDALSSPLTKKIVGAAVNFVEKISNNNTEHCYQPKNWQKAHEILVVQIRKNPNFLRVNNFLAVQNYGKKQVAYAKQISGKNLAKSTSQQLNNYYQKYCQLNTELYGYGLLLPLLDFQTTTFLTDEISKFLKNKKATQYFSILTTPLQDTFNKVQEFNLLKILIQIRKKTGLLTLFKELESAKLVLVLPEKNKAVWQQIRNHTRKYAWVHYVYQGPAADEAYFIDIIRDFVRRKVDPAKTIAQHKKEKTELKLKQQKILDKLKPDNYHRQILLLARDSVYFKIFRRDLQTRSYYYMEPLLLEIGRRLGLSLKQVRMMLPEEIEIGLLKNKVDLDEINRRFKSVIYLREGSARKIFSGEKAAAYFKNNFKIEKIKISAKEIRGTTAQPGKNRGIVRIINSPEEMTKMNQGDILVSGSTNPNLMPAIRKAAAIVTDEGGLTCHAAIVSREFKIPCVVGTNIATKVLKDGDKVEVDATKGVVRKL